MAYQTTKGMPTEELESVQEPDSTENKPSFLPKLEDLVALTGLFNPERIVEEIQELDEPERPPLSGAQSAESAQ